MVKARRKERERATRVKRKVRRMEKRLSGSSLWWPLAVPLAWPLDGRRGIVAIDYLCCRFAEPSSVPIVRSEPVNQGSR